MKNQAENLWQTHEFAQKAKVTVRTLHHYDRLGLLKPRRRTAKGFRLYGEAEFARLQQILTLKFIGFPLQQIREILGDKDIALDDTLEMQKSVLEEQRRRLNSALEAIRRAKRAFAERGEIDWESFQKIIEVIDMEQNTDWSWTQKYYSESALAKLEERKSLWSPELQERVTKDWNDLIRDIETAIADGVQPHEEPAQALAARWNGFIEEFTGGDAEIREGLNKMYAAQANGQTSWEKPYRKEVEIFIVEAMTSDNSNLKK